MHERLDAARRGDLVGGEQVRRRARAEAELALGVLPPRERLAAARDGERVARRGRHVARERRRLANGGLRQLEAPRGEVMFPSALETERRARRAPRVQLAALRDEQRVVEARRHARDAPAADGQHDAARHGTRRLIAYAEAAADAEAAGVGVTRAVDEQRVVLPRGEAHHPPARLHAAGTCGRALHRTLARSAERHGAGVAPCVHLAKRAGRRGGWAQPVHLVQQLERREALVVERRVHARACPHERRGGREFAAEEGAVQRRVARLAVLQRSARTSVEEHRDALIMPTRGRVHQRADAVIIQIVDGDLCIRRRDEG